MNSKSLLVEVLCHQGHLLHTMKKLSECEKVIREIDSLVGASDSKAMQANIDYLRGCYCAGTKDFSKARLHLNRALKLFAQMCSQLNLGMTYVHLGRLEKDAGNKAASKKHFEKARDVFQAIGATDWKEKAMKELH